MAFASLTVDLTAKIAKFEENMDRATKGVDNLSRRASSLADGFKAAFGAVAIGGLVALAKSGIDAADALGKLSIKTGVGVKDLAAYRLAAESADTSLEDVGKAMQRLRVSIGDADLGNVQLQDSLKRLGVTTRDPKAAFEQLADAVKNSIDPSRTAADLAKVLGKSYANLLPLLSGGGQALRDSAQASESFAEAMARLAPDAEKFNDDLTALKIEAAGAAGSLLTKLVPGLSATSERVRELLDDDKGVQALFRALAGIGKIPFDLAFGDIKAASTAKERISELNEELKRLERSKSLRTVGQVLPDLFVKNFSELDREILIRKNQIESLEKFGDKIYKPKPQAEAPKPDVDLAGIGIEDQAEKFQAALKKAFNITPMDKFLAQFKDKRKKISDEYARLKADLTGPALDNIKGFDIQAELRKGQAALSNGDATGAEIATERLKEMLKSFSASEGAASFEKSFFTDQIKAFELSIVDAEEKIAATAQETINTKIKLLSADAEQLKVTVDGDAIVSQVKDAVAKVKDELARNPLQIPIVAIQSVSTDGRQSVDISREALKYGRR